MCKHLVYLYKLEREGERRRKGKRLRLFVKEKTFKRERKKNTYVSLKLLEAVDIIRVDVIGRLLLAGQYGELDAAVIVRHNVQVSR